MQIFNFDENDYNEIKDNFTLIINRRVLIEVMDYYGDQRSAFRTVVTECDDDLEFSRSNESTPYLMAYNPHSATIIVDAIFSERQEAISKACAIAASYQA